MRTQDRPILVLSICVAAVLATFTATNVRASGSTEEALIKQGLALRRAGRDGDALPKFEEAYRLSKSPRAAAQWGLCLQAMSRWSEADPLLGEALSALQDSWVKKNRETLKDSQEAVKAHLGRLQIIGSPEGAAVTVGGVNVGRFPLQDAVTVNEGVVDVEVSADGYQPMSRTVSAAGASYQRIVIRLQPESRSMSPSQDVNETTAARATEGDVNAEARSNRPFFKNPWVWAGTAAVIIAVAAIAVALSQTSSSSPYDADRTIP